MPCNNRFCNKLIILLTLDFLGQVLIFKYFDVTYAPKKKVESVKDNSMNVLSDHHDCVLVTLV